MRIVVIAFVVLIACWFISVKIQQAQRYPIAEKLIEEKLKELVAASFDALVGMIGRGYIQETKVVDRISYYMGYVVSKPSAIGGIHTNESLEVKAPVQLGEIVNEVEVVGYVDCVTIVPFVYFKMGPSFSKILKRSGNFSERGK